MEHENAEVFREGTTPLLRPEQVKEMEEERERIEGTLAAPPYISNQIQDRGAARRTLAKLDRQIETQRPQPYFDEEKDLAVRRMHELEQDIAEGMPTDGEMRRAPAGAVDKHMRWERRNKQKILELKNIKLRIHAGGDSPDHLEESTDLANIELMRPKAGSPGEMNMHNEQIPGRVQFGPEPGAGPAVVFSARELDFLSINFASIHQRLALMANTERAEIRAMVEMAMKDGEPQVTSAPVAAIVELGDLASATQTTVGKAKPPKHRTTRGPSTYNILQKEAKALGINPFGMTAEAIRAAIDAKSAEGGSQEG